MTNKVQMIVSDLDGTLLNSRGSLTKNTIDALIKIQKTGVKLVLCTGRPFYSCKDITNSLKLKEYQGAFIGLNGQYLYDYKINKSFEEKMLNYDQLKEIYKIAINSGAYSMEFYQDGKIFVLFNNKHFLSFIISILYSLRSLIHQSKKYKVKFIKKIPENIQAPKVCFLGKNTDLSKIINQISKKKELCSYLVNPNWLEILNDGISKGNTLSKLSNLCNIPLENAIAFGDGENDITMLSVVGKSFAMKNAMNSVKDKASEVIGSNSNDSVAEKCLEILKLK
ncbi:MAG: Cof-type HAD-IIB family hydrolase [Anaerorhabdus sp.]